MDLRNTTGGAWDAVDIRDTLSRRRWAVVDKIMRDFHNFLDTYVLKDEAIATNEDHDSIYVIVSAPLVDYWIGWCNQQRFKLWPVDVETTSLDSVLKTGFFFATFSSYTQRDLRDMWGKEDGMSGLQVFRLFLLLPSDWYAFCMQRLADQTDTSDHPNLTIRIPNDTDPAGPLGLQLDVQPADTIHISAESGLIDFSESDLSDSDM